MMLFLLKHELHMQFIRPSFWLIAAALYFLLGWLLFTQLESYAALQTQLVASQSPLGINDLLVEPTLNTLVLALLFAVPLLGMPSLVDERQSGRLAILLSAPIHTWQIIFSKWLGIALPGLLLLLGGLLLISGLAFGMAIDFARLCSAALLLSLYVLALAAISLMFSSMAHHPASALATSYGLLFILWLSDSFLSVGSLWHSFALNPQLRAAFAGQLYSHPMVYFVVLSSFALWLSYHVLQSERYTRRWPRILLSSMFGIVLLGLGQLHQPYNQQLYSNQTHNIPPALVNTLKVLKGTIHITAFSPENSLTGIQTRKLIEPLQDHHAHLRLEFIDPQQEPRLAKKWGIQKPGELIVQGMGRSHYLSKVRYSTLLKAFNHLAQQDQPWILFLQGHGEADLHSKQKDGLFYFAEALRQQGYNTLAFNPLQNNQIPSNVLLVVAAGAKQDYSAAVQQTLQDYLAQDGQILWLHENTNDIALDALFNVQVLPGTIVDASAERAKQPVPWHIPIQAYPQPLFTQAPQQQAILQGAKALLNNGSDWQKLLQLQSSTQSWNETSQLEGVLKRTPILGEQQGPLTVLLALQRGLTRAVLVGDSEFIHNAHLGVQGNREMALSLVHWLSDIPLSPLPIANDLAITWNNQTAFWVSAIQLVALPVLLLLIAYFLQRKRQHA